VGSKRTLLGRVLLQYVDKVVAVSLPKLTASTNLLCYVQSLLNCSLVVLMGKDEKMSHCLYFSSIL
jgi:hypothetical protein